MSRWQQFVSILKRLPRPTIHVHHHHHYHAKDGHLSDEAMRRIHEAVNGAFESADRAFDTADRAFKTIDEETRKHRK